MTVHGGDELERFEGDERVAKVVTRGGLELDADAVVIGAGVTPDVQLAQRAGLEIGERGGVTCSSRLETLDAGRVRGGRHLRIRVGRARRRARAHRALGRGVQPRQDGRAEHARPATCAHEVVPYFFSVFADWGELEYVGPAYEWDARSCAARSTMASSATGTCKDGVVKAALSVGRSDDLDAARRLIADGRALDDGELAQLGDTRADLTTSRATSRLFSRRAGWRANRSPPATRQSPSAPAAPKPVGTRVSSCEEITRSISPYSRACSAVK